MTLRPAAPADLAAVLELLRAADLPTEGVDPALRGFVVAEEGRIVAAGGLEVHGDSDAPGLRGDAGLLRSVVVDPAWRGRGLGEAVTRRLLAAAADGGPARVYLLTTTAAGWFPRLGFRPIERHKVPPAVKRSQEFRETCPASATVMMLELDR